MDETNLEAGLKLLKDRATYPHIPTRVIKYAERCHEGGIQERLISALSVDPKGTVSDINKMFAKACRITRLSADDLMAATDFSPKDTDPTRLPAAFAEIRMINHLSDEGFSDIRLEKAGVRRRCNIIARRQSVQYVVEVANSPQEAEYRHDSEQIAKWLVKRLVRDKKSEQLDSTASEFGQTKRVFVGVYDTRNPYSSPDEYLNAAQRAWKYCGCDPALHFCIMTGLLANDVSEDCVYPPWP